jgi:hypothetical protein
MRDVRRLLGVCVAFGAVLAGCSGIRGDAASVDPDLQPLVSEAAPQQAILEPDEVIGPPDAPGADLVGADAPAQQGPTQHVSMEADPAGSDQITAPPKREKMPSLMSDLLWGPRDN